MTKKILNELHYVNYFVCKISDESRLIKCSLYRVRVIFYLV